MESSDPIVIESFMALTFGIVVFFLGRSLTKRFPILSTYSIPEPVSGGLLAALAALGVVLLTGREIEYDLYVRDYLLIYFFTTVGLNARLSDLARGGPILGVMLALTVGYMLIQNLVGALTAFVTGLPIAAGVLLGSASLIGGHGTAIAWGPVLQDQYGVVGAVELGVAAATVGLIAASLIGGPIGNYLIQKNNLKPDPADLDDGTDPGADAPRAGEKIDSVGIMRAIFWMHVAIVLGFFVHEALQEAGVMLPLFVPCLLAGIFLSNTIPNLFRGMTWPAATPSLALISEFSLSVFLSMSLMSMQLWTLAASAGPLLIGIVAQSVIATLFILLVVFRFMGRNYFAGVISAGFAGFALGATPTAIANMTAVTRRFGPAPLAFIVLPLVSAFFVDLANAFIIQWFLGLTTG